MAKGFHAKSLYCSSIIYTGMTWSIILMKNSIFQEIVPFLANYILQTSVKCMKKMCIEVIQILLTYSLLIQCCCCHLIKNGLF